MGLGQVCADGYKAHYWVIQFNTASLWFLVQGQLTGVLALVAIIAIAMIAIGIFNGFNYQNNYKTQDSQKKNDQRGHVEAQSTLAVSPGSLQISSHLHVSCLRQIEKNKKDERVNAMFK